jgi:hypothetical protein
MSEESARPVPNVLEIRDRLDCASHYSRMLGYAIGGLSAELRCTYEAQGTITALVTLADDLKKISNELGSAG